MTDLTPSERSLDAMDQRAWEARSVFSGATERMVPVSNAAEVADRLVAEAVQAERSIDAAHLAHQRAWSLDTFGPGSRLNGVLDHIGKELQEIRDDPTDVGEWVDVIILAFDGAWRAGWEPQEIIDAIKAKQAKNESREWPDWRTASPDKAIEHVRSIVETDTDEQ